MEKHGFHLFLKTLILLTSFFTSRSETYSRAYYKLTQAGNDQTETLKMTDLKLGFILCIFIYIYIHFFQLF